MGFKVGDKAKIVLCEGDPKCSYLGEKVTITKAYLHSTGVMAYKINMNTGEHWWIDKELELIKENDMSVKYYKVVKDHPFWETGAIVSNEDVETNYKAINDIFMKQYTDSEDFEPSLSFKALVVEYSDFFERVYQMGKLEKMLFGTKKQAQAAAMALYKGDKK